MKTPDISGLESVPSPSLLFDEDAVRRNLELTISIAGSPDLARPHIKTHKCGEIVRMMRESGITAIKAATIAEGELAAREGIPDVLVSYPLVGPNAERLAALAAAYPKSSFSCLVDSHQGLEDVAHASDGNLGVFLDLDCGMHRTGIEPGDAALELLREIVARDEVRFAGLHAYDGHIHDASLEARRDAFARAMEMVDAFLARADAEAIDVPLVVSGGSPTFALHAERARSSSRPWQCSPGTTLLWDAGYGEHYPDLAFEPAALLLTRVVSHPGENFVCLELGHKAVSGENPIEYRVRFPGVEITRFVSQSEEHLVIEVPDRTHLPIGRILVGIPWHVCPTVALYQRARIIRGGAVTEETWEIAARDRTLGV